MMMTQSLTSPLGVPMIFCIILIFLAELYLLILAYRMKRSAGTLFLRTALFISLCLVLCVGLDILWKPQLTRISWIEYLRGRSLMFFAAAALIHLGLVIAYTVDVYIYSRNHVLDTALKEAFDLLPVGVCFGTAEGQVRMANMKMNEASVRLLGQHLVNLNRFWEALAGLGEENQDRIIVREENSTLQFVRSLIHVEGQEYQQLILTDVSDQYRIRDELREKNRHLREYQSRMKKYQQLSAEMIRSEEILNARRTVHDQVGHVLLTAGYYFSHPENVDKRALLEMLRQTNLFLLREAQEDDMGSDPLGEGIRRAEAIGVKVVIHGQVPLTQRVRELTGYAIRECAANTVKHGDGDELTVSITPGKEEMEICFRNNGRTFEGAVRETGGLLSLRKMTEELSGQMRVQAAPVFEVSILLPSETAAIE